MLLFEVDHHLKLLFDNIIYFLQRSGGGSVYWTELIKRFAAEYPADCHFIEQGVRSENALRQSLELRSILPERRLPLKITRYLPLTIPVAGPAVFHSSYYRVSMRPEVLNMVTVHDFTHERCRKGLPRLVASQQKAFAIRRADGIICVSNNTRRDLLEFFPEIRHDKIRVIPNGVGDEFFRVPDMPDWFVEKHKALLQRQVVLYVGHRTSYKNFPLAAAAVRQAGRDYVLGVVGEPLSDEEKTLLDTSIPGSYAYLGRVPTSELNLLYNAAHCLIYPSSYEGFGIPLLEAMKAGCPVVAAARSSLPEVANGCALMVEDLEADAFAKPIQLLATDAGLRRRLVDDGLRNAGQYSWEETYRMTRDFFKDLVRAGSSEP